MEGSMKKIKSFCSIILAIIVLIPFLYICQSQEKPREIEAAEPLQYMKIYTDSDGQSHFAEAEVSFQLVDYAPPSTTDIYIRSFQC